MGDLDLDSIQNIKSTDNSEIMDATKDEPEASVPISASDVTKEPEAVDPLTYEPNVSKDGIWTLTETDMGKAGVV